MNTISHGIDFSGARGSNTGDQFHELWALLQVLDLLVPETDLKAVGVEGVRSETPAHNADDQTWEGVDCTLYYGGTTLETADRIEFVQLKYSAANPDKSWSVARLTANTAKKGNNSVIRKMADEFKAAQARMKQGGKLKIRLVSNQNLSEKIIETLSVRWSGPLETAGKDQETISNLKRLNAATGLTLTEFQAFLDTLDFSDCGSRSRFAVRERVVAAVANLIGDDVLPYVRDLQFRARELMLPERAGEIVSEKDIFLWFGLSGREGLFPCPSDIRKIENAVSRSAADEAVRLMKMGERLVLVHGIGGCGKTTLMHQIADRLPKGSVTVFFDCFGGGRYTYSDDKRHLPENAFLHLANELSISLHLPLFIPRSIRHPATIKSFLAKLRLAGEALKQISPGGILLIIIDAADNSVAAAETSDPPEHPFVFDLFGANLSALPDNIRIVTSCRTNLERRASLRLPSNTPDIICPSFTLKETRQHLKITIPCPSDSLVEQFHILSNANPRVQAYAIAASDGDRTRLLKALLPGGKRLSDVLKTSFDNALSKLGHPQIFAKLIGSLAFLPAPIALPSIARIVDCTEDTVRDFALDLSPGLRLSGNAVTIADEDFDAFIKDKASVNREATIANIAEDFITTFQTDPYSSLHVADTLIASGRAQEVLTVIEKDPMASAISDPIVRRQVQVRRLKLSLAACKKAGSTSDALKTVLISAEAERDDSTLKKVLEKELDLSVEFAGSSLRRTVLLDPDRVKKHGSFLAQDAVRAIRASDRATAREQLYFHEAWLRRRRKLSEQERKYWTVTDFDISARVETILELSGPKAAFDELVRWSPRNISLRVAYFLVPQLIAAGKVHYIKALLKEFPSLGPWDLLLWVPLAMAGESVDGNAIENSLRRIRRRFIPDAGVYLISYGEKGLPKKLLDTFISACELAFMLDLDRQIILKVVNLILEALEGKQKRSLYRSDVNRLENLIRCWILKQEISGRAVSDNDFIEYVKTINPEPKPERRRSGKRLKKGSGNRQTDDQEVEQLNRNIRAVFPVYSTRLQILSFTGQNQQVIDEQLNKLANFPSHAYDYDYVILCDKAAQSIMGLLMIANIEASELVMRASKLAEGRSSDQFARLRRKLWTQMRLRPSESEKLVRLAAKAAEDIKGLRAASSEKLDAIIRLSRLILPISRDDAGSLFNDAIVIAKEIDLEAFDQIDFLSVLAQHARISEQPDRRLLAGNILAFISGAAERLSNHEEFPWKSAVHALTCVDHPSALSAISRWADNGTIRLEETLDHFLLTALQRGIIGPEVSTALALLVGGSDDDLRKELVSQAAADPDKFEVVIEELARETLLLFHQDARLQLGQEIIRQVPSDYSGRIWLSHLRDMVSFLGHATDVKSAKETTIRRDKVIRMAKENDLPKAFEFEPQGCPFTTPESIAEVLASARSSGLRYHDRNLLKKMRDVSSGLRHRVQFLNALAGVPKDTIWVEDHLEFIRDTLSAWKKTPAVDQWCKGTLPSVLIIYFHGATRWLKQGQSVLHQLLDHTESGVDGRLRIILEGVSHAGEALSSRSLFAVAEEITRHLDVDEAGALLIWYAQHLRQRLSAEDLLMGSSAELPNDETESIARFLFALMSDIDTRVRWKAAHALRRLAMFGCFDIVKATVSQSSRAKDDDFRDPSGPFYFLAAKLWLAISLYRISAETPEALRSCKTQLFDLAVSAELPHVAIREYAKRALLQLSSAGLISLTLSETAILDQINTALRGKTSDKTDARKTFRRERKYKPIFNFDETDTIPYWYSSILEIFPTITLNRVLEIADRWIIDKWGAGPEARWWKNEPRKARYDDRRYTLWMNDHGSLPVVERYGTYLEWNAMYCVVGELLLTHQISNQDESSICSFESWLGEVLPTEAPTWISDNRGPTPLEDRFWKEDPRTDRGWLYNIRRDEYLTELGVKVKFRQGWFVVKGDYSVHFPGRETSIRINSALVSPETAPALVRALQTASNSWDFRIPYENDDLQFDVPPYRLLGWLKLVEGDVHFDDHDPFRYEVSKVRYKPGRNLTEALGLVQQVGSHQVWTCNDSGKLALIYEAWCDEPISERDYYPRRVRSNGWRLWASSDMVRSFICNGGWDLICEVQVERKLRNKDGLSYEPNAKKKTHEKILHFRGDGSLADANGHIGSWTRTSSRTRS